MRYEIICFRLMILVILGSLFGFGGGWAYYTADTKDWQKLVSDSHEKMNATAIECDQHRGPVGSCEFFKIWEESFDSSVVGRDNSKAKANLFGTLVWLIPLSTLILFYSLRWAFTGRFRPLIVLPSPNRP